VENGCDHITGLCGASGCNHFNHSVAASNQFGWSWPGQGGGLTPAELRTVNKHFCLQTRPQQ